jgi:hypothetical protein
MLDPRDYPSERSLDYEELTFEEAIKGISVEGTLPPYDGTIAGFQFWDNNFGGFYRRPDGSFFYN